MNKNTTFYIVLFLVLTLLQVLVFNNLVVFHTGVCFCFIYLILRLPLSLPLNWLYTIAFLSGFAVDVFSDTPGVNSLSCLVLAALKRPVTFAYVQRDDKTKSATPTLSTMGWGAYSKYLLTLTAIFCLVYFTVEFMSLADLRQVLAMAGASTLFTFPVLLGTDCVLK